VLLSALLQVLADKIRDFFSKFIGPASGDVTDGIADMDIEDEDSDPETQRMKGLKYMSQLVCFYHNLSSTTRPKPNLATHRKS
jgi:hypothetical protein